MKMIYLTIICLSVFALKATAQSTDPLGMASKSNIHFAKLDFSFGVEWDEYGSMSKEDFMAFSTDPTVLERDLTGLTEEATTSTAGGVFYTHFCFSPLNLRTGEYRSDREIRIGLGLHTAKEAMLSYKSELLDTSIVYCNLQSEVSIEASYLFKGTWGKRDKWHWYVGIGGSLASTFDNEMMLITGKYFGPDQHPSEQPEKDMNVESYEAKSVRYARIYFPYGIGYQLGSHFIVGFDFRKGYGLQVIQGGSTNIIERGGAFLFGLKYQFK